MSEPPRGRLPRGRHGLPREVVTSSQRTRLEAAVVEVTAAKGYEATTVGDVLERAGVGRETFYELFTDKRDCTLVAHDRLVDELEARIRIAYLGPAPWPERAREAVATALAFFAERPPVARFMLVELFAIGAPARERFQQGFNRFVALLEEGLDEDPGDGVPVRPTSLAVGAVAARTYEEVLVGRASELPQLVPELTYELLVPFVGEAAAEEAAAG
ncbi:MAG: TetR/AcrR family transcriptional regulator [Actinobacteria bacterium]|nr:TetR/AcrR family transcriptional regulator [Actinomycetota bacterium]